MLHIFMLQDKQNRLSGDKEEQNLYLNDWKNSSYQQTEADEAARPLPLPPVLL